MGAKKNMITKIKSYLLSSVFLRNVNNMAHENMDLNYKFQDLNKDYYKKIKDLDDVELEHQIGRLTNFKDILFEINDKKIEGDIIEFGIWRGFSLLWIAYLCERIGIYNKKIIGIDGFIGLPASDGIFKKGMFKDTSLELCRRNILHNRNLYNITKKNVFIEKFLYSEKEAILNWLKEIKCKKFCFVHIDCDIAESANEIFDILISGDLIADKCFILFDDYNCQSNLKKTVDKFFIDADKIWVIEEFSGTKLTKNFLLIKKI